MYGCENKDPTLRLQERVFPNMMSRNTSKFKYSSCRYKDHKNDSTKLEFHLYKFNKQKLYFYLDLKSRKRRKGQAG